MASTIAYVCQGCEKMVADRAEMHERGFVNKKLYCGGCVVAVDEYLGIRDDIHTDIATQWSVMLSELHYKFTKRGIKGLPDGG